MRDTIDAHVARNSSKAKHREHFVSIIGFNNLADIKNRVFVLVLLTHSVKRAWLCWLSIRGCVVDSDHDGVADYQDNCPGTGSGAGGQ